VSGHHLDGEIVAEEDAAAEDAVDPVRTLPSPVPEAQSPVLRDEVRTAAVAVAGVAGGVLAGAATAVRGVRLLAAEPPDGDALAHAGLAVAEACAACQQATGAIGFTLEYPLHGYTQRARALVAWNDALLDRSLSRPPARAGDAGRA